MSVNNLSKIMQYLLPLSKKAITIDDEVFDTPRKSIILSPTFFDVDGCDSCGKCCCITENLLLTQKEYERLMAYTDQDFIDYGLQVENLHNLQNTIVPTKHIINGKEITVYICPERKQKMIIDTKDPEKEREVCYHLFKKEDGIYRCKIHPVRSITCRMPHTRVFHSSSGSTSIGISQYGRNWALGCGVKFRSPANKEEFDEQKSTKIAQFEYLKEVSDDLNIETYLPELIDYMKKCTFDNYKEMLGKNLLPIFTSNHSLFKNIV